MGFLEISKIFKEANWRRGVGCFSNTKKVANFILGVIHQEIEEQSRAAFGSNEMAAAQSAKRKTGMKHLLAFVKEAEIAGAWDCRREVLADRIYEAVLAATDVRSHGNAESIPALGRGFLSWVCGEADRSECFNSDEFAFLGVTLKAWFSRELALHDGNPSGAINAVHGLRAFRRWMGQFADIPDDALLSIDVACHGLRQERPDIDTASRMVAAVSDRLSAAWGEQRSAMCVQITEAGISSPLQQDSDEVTQANIDIGRGDGEELLAGNQSESSPFVCQRSSQALSMEVDNGWLCCSRCLLTLANIERLYPKSDDLGGALARADALEAQARFAAARGAAPDAGAQAAFDKIVNNQLVSHLRPHPLFLFAALRSISQDKLTAPEEKVGSQFLISPPHPRSKPIDCGNPLMGITIAE